MTFVTCAVKGCNECIGPLDTDPAPEHYNRVNLAASGWVQVGDKYYCAKHAQELDLTRQLNMFGGINDFSNVG